MKFTTRDRTVFIGCKYRDVFFRGECNLWELPLAEVVGVICQVPAFKIDWATRRVIDFDPV